MGQGNNELLKLGARLVSTPADVPKALNLQTMQTELALPKASGNNPSEEAILCHLSREPVHIDKLKKLAGLDSSRINSTLTLMEMRGIVKNVGGMNYVISQ